jgi:hypothetical protein
MAALPDLVPSLVPNLVPDLVLDLVPALVPLAFFGLQRLFKMAAEPF